ncbi:DUF4136 domain-containing protein [Ferruginibacter sp. SUN106]|uniref:DUF4136 domain-containing protein n=1 Tax=Ferruginibacter sp. SUN106 TaxID=2978348 RepID=UPI003D3663FA
MTIQSIKSGAFAVVAGIFMAGCGSTAHVEKAKNANMGEYKTYSWIAPEKARGAKPNRRNDIALQNIRSAVNDELQKKGWQEVKNDPDVLVSSELLVEKSQKEQSDPVYSNSYVRSYYNPRTGRYNNFYYPSRFMGYNSYSTTVKEGTITIMLIDTKTDRTVWQGWSTDELNTAQITDREINKNVRSIFKKFDVAK